MKNNRLSSVCILLLLPLVLSSCGSPAARTRPTGAAVAGRLSPSFPRLGMWWPNTWEQSAAEIARYDWVIFGNWDLPNLPAIKAQNPDLLALNSTNACELSFDPDPNADPADNEEVRSMPAEWFLTQVGTSLRQAVDATTTLLPVEAVEVSDGAQTYDLFVAGDAALIEGESVLVETVDKPTRALIVQRGYIRPAAEHAAGTRIAAHISFWPDSWMMNLSTLSPRARQTSGAPLETWAEYNARRAAALLADPGWDGILLDRSDPDESWLIGNSTARTIDPDQSNTLPDDYQTFDVAWNAGLAAYMTLLRQAVGENKIIYTNWGAPNYGLLNGNNFEGFPLEDTSAYDGSWRQTVFGPWVEKGSYYEWMHFARNPNLTMIETYEDEDGVDATGDGSYDNPCRKAGFTPNYRKMRFGLTTALLNDGYFSYEINTNGHGALCLLWFDEYDNAGRGRGYLGQPLAPAMGALQSQTSANLLAGGDLETDDDLAEWDFWAEEGEGYQASLTLETGAAAQGDAAARIEVIKTAGVDWQVSFNQAPLALTKDLDYTLSFWARADRQRMISVWAQKDSPDWDTRLDFGQIQLGEGWQHYQLSAQAMGSDPQAILQFGFGQVSGTVWLDGVTLQPGRLDVWRRDFSGGLVLVNASSSAQTVELGGEFRKILGTQVPQVNDGSLVRQVTLPPHDGLILLRIGGLEKFLPWVDW